MYCKKCGTEQRNGHKYCPKCGMPYTIINPTNNNLVKQDIVSQSYTESSQGISTHPDVGDFDEKQPAQTMNQKKIYVASDSNANLFTNIWFWIGIIGILVFGYYVFTNTNENTLHYPVLFCVIAMANPIITILKDDNSALNTGILISIVLCIITTIVGFVIKEETSNGLFVDFLTSLTSLTFQYVFLVLVVVANAIVKMKELCLYTISVLIGLLAPIAIALILYVVLLVIAIAVCLVLGYLFSGSSSSSSSSLSFSHDSPQKDKKGNMSNVRDNQSNKVQYYKVYRRGNYAPNSYIEEYPKNVDPSQIMRDLRKRIGTNATLIDYHIYRPFNEDIHRYY